MESFISSTTSFTICNDIITLIAIASCTIAELQFVITSHAKYTLPPFFLFFGFVVVCETRTYAKRTNKKEKKKKQERRTINK